MKFSVPASGGDLAFAVATILLVCSILPAFIGGQPVGRPSETDVVSIQEGGDAVRQAVMLGLYAAHALAIVWLVRPRALWLLGAPVMLFVAWAALSASWSPLPDPTMRRVVALAGTVTAGLFLSLRLGATDLSRAFRAAAAIAVAGSIFHAAAFPSLAFDHDGHFRGLFAHKNLLGSFMAIAILALVHRMGSPQVRSARLADGALLLACLGCLVLAHSATPVLGLVAALGFYFTFSLAGSGRSLPRVLAPAVLCGGLAAVLTFGGPATVAVAEALGRDPSFSGRTNVWNFVMGAIAEHPLAGYGYGIFWLGENAPGAAFWFWSRQYELHAHNGFLQLLLDAGAVGMVLFLCALLVLLRRLLSLSRSWEGDRLAPWVAMVLGFFLACNLSESRILQGNDLLTMLFVWSVARVNLAWWRRGVTAGALRRYHSANPRGA
jgi:O-antigen ligase